MTPEIAYVMGLFVVALALFSFEILAVDVVALLVLLALTVPSSLPPPFRLEILGVKQALGDFGDETVLLLIGDFMLTIGLVRTGVTADIGRRIFAAGAKRLIPPTNRVLTRSSWAKSSISRYLRPALSDGSARMPSSTLWGEGHRASGIRG